MFSPSVPLNPSIHEGSHAVTQGSTSSIVVLDLTVPVHADIKCVL